MLTALRLKGTPKTFIDKLRYFFRVHKQHPWPNKLASWQEGPVTICMQPRDYRERRWGKNNALHADQSGKDIEFLWLEMFNLSRPPTFQGWPSLVGGLDSTPHPPPTSPKLAFCRCACRENGNLGNLLFSSGIRSRNDFLGSRLTLA